MALVGCITSNRGDFQSPGTLEGSNAMSTTVKSPIFRGPVPGVFFARHCFPDAIGYVKKLMGMAQNNLTVCVGNLDGSGSLETQGG